MNYKIYVNRQMAGWMVTALAFMFWALIPWLYFAPPEFMFGSPLALIGFGLLLFGLVFFITGSLLGLRSLAHRFVWAQRMLRLRALLILTVSLAIVTPYLLSPLAPNWSCATAPIRVAIANAQSKNCTETCTDWNGRPCGGWSTCYNKNISCSSGGIDQNGRSCQGCCFSCKIVCDDPTPTPMPPTSIPPTATLIPPTLIPSTSTPIPPTPTRIPSTPTPIPPTPTRIPSTPTPIPPTPTPIVLPPTVSSSLACDIWGGEGWCRRNGRLVVSASDPQDYSVSITGSSPNFSCTGSCSVSLPAGRSVASYTATSSISGMSASGSRSWAYDPIAPIASMSISGTDGLNGWYTSSVKVTANASDFLSGIASVKVSSGGDWSPSINLTQDGSYHVQVAAVDVAGNTTASAQAIGVDTTAPSINISVAGSLESSGWYSSSVQLSATATDATSGVNGNVLVSVNGGAWQALPLDLSLDGLYSAKFRVFDVAGNVANSQLSLRVDTTAPSIFISAAGSLNASGWYSSPVQLSATAFDATSGVNGNVLVSLNGGAWQNLPLDLSLDGLYSAKFRVFDVAGNVTNSQLSLRVDTSAPSIFISAAGSLESSGWFSSPVQLSATATDATSGVDGSVLVSLNGGAWQALPLDLTENGYYSAKFRVYDLAGNKTDSQISLKVDATAPTISVSERGNVGQAGWYVSDATVSASATDALSGLVSVQYRVDAGAWVDGVSVVVGSGIHTVQFQASDAAGNLQTASRKVMVDTTPPVAAFEATLNNSVLSGSVQLLGMVSDVHSGVASVEFSADGATWLPTSVSAAGWNFMWNTLSFKNGKQPIFLRARDVAGNLGEPVQGNPILDNYPPYVSLSESWNVWETGSLLAQPNGIPLKSIRVVVKDPLMRYPDTVLSDDNPASPSIAWDRILGNMIAPPGKYMVIAEACDLYGLCSKDTGTITIPPGIPLSTLTPTPIPESYIEPRATATSQSTPTELPLDLPTPPSVIAPTPPQIERSLIWPVIVLAMLLFMFTFLLLSDPRPAALRSLARAIQLSIQEHTK